ncbi:MAG: tetratricopeptide repeat protein [Elusimicrobia bacterium]|nr:tetratricopeptide repeat protein [Elusimicrobiota bacterium]
MEQRSSMIQLAMVVACTIAVGVAASLRFPQPAALNFPPLNELRFGDHALMDVGGVFLGLRRLTADLAWIQLLLYYGTPEEGPGEESGGHHHPDPLSYGGGRYERFLEYCQRVVRIDPSFITAYLYGAGALAWNLKRSDEAVELLQEGVQRNPQAWQFHKYLAAIGFKQRGEFAKVASLLEEAIRDPACPSMVINILGNTYKDEGRYPEALRVFLELYDRAKDPEYQTTALKQIRWLSERLHLPFP